MPQSPIPTNNLTKQFQLNNLYLEPQQSTLESAVKIINLKYHYELS